MGLLNDRESQLLIDGKLVAGSGGHVPDGQPGHRGGAGRRRRRDRRRHGPGDRGGPPRVRRHRLVDEHRVAGALHASAAGRAHQARRGTPRADHRRGRRAADADVRSPAGRPGRRPELLRGHRRVVCSGPPTSESPSRWVSRLIAPSHGRRSVSSARSPRGTSRTRSTSPSSALRWRRATPSSSSRRPTRRGARRSSASSSPSTPTSRPACSTSSPPATTASARCCRKTHAWTWFRSPGRRRRAAR